MSNNPRVILINNTAEADASFRSIHVDRAGIEIMRDKAVFRVVRVDGVSGRAANILKQEMLARGGEAAVARSVYDLKADPTDVILMGTLRQYQILLEKLSKQPFGLSELAQEINKVLESYDLPVLPIKWDKHHLDLPSRTHVMGVLNVTPDSFSDAGFFLDVEKAVQHGLMMIEDGADIIDIGGESTRPGAPPVDVDEELKRVIPVIEGLRKETKKPISVDTYKADIVSRALEAGADMVNDITALRGDDRMAGLVAEYDVPLVIMHMKGTPQDMQEDPRYDSIIGEISGFLRKQAAKALQAGIKREHIIVDPGIGFGKTREHNLKIIKNLSELKSLGFAIMVGTSRKSFIGMTLDLPVEERVEGTAATVACSILNGANIVRVHDVKEMVRVVRMTDAIVKADLDDSRS